MIKIQIDGTSYEVIPGKNLLDTCLGLGIDVPYFCFHPAMDSVGSCRLCAVKKYANAGDTRGRLVMSCMEPVTDGMIISIADPEARAFRAAILESLMTNHPHDCPICDEGGECHLQDMTVMTGHNYRRFSFKKRTYTNQYLGPFINHEMNRCIQCYRCVRFYKDYAGGKDLDVFGSANHVYFGRHEEGVLESEFSGNLVDVCPTGVFTDKTLKQHYTRKWDLTHAPSICVHCSLGCNTIAGERYGKLRRILSRYNSSVNAYFICDRGRFGYEFVNDDDRVKTSKLRSSKDVDLTDAPVDIINASLSTALIGKKIIGIGSPRSSLEANYALSKLTGEENFYHGISRKEHKLVKEAINILKNSPAHSPSLKETGKADAILILGEDITNTAPMMALAVRQASRAGSLKSAENIGIPTWHDNAVRELAQDVKSHVFIATSFSTKLDELAEDTYYASPLNIARLGFAMSSMISGEAPVVYDLDSSTTDLASKIARVLKDATNPVIISGVHSGCEEILQACGNIVKSLSSAGKEVSLSFTFPECNSLGLGMMPGGSLEDAFEIIEKDQAETLVILENDLYRRVERERLEAMFIKCPHVIVLDHTMNETAMNADILLASGSFAESEGDLVNNEGRVQRHYSVFPLVEPLKESWRWIRDMMVISGVREAQSWQHFDDVVTSMADSLPAFSKIKDHNSTADFRMLNEKIARQPLRYSGRTAMNANIAVSEPKPPQDADSPLSFSMEGYQGKPPSSLVPYYWSAGWNSVQAMNKYIGKPDEIMKDDDSAVLLFEHHDHFTMDFFREIPDAFTPRPGEWLIIPVYQIFGSEELSSRGKAIAERIPEAFVLLNDKDAEERGNSGNSFCVLKTDRLKLKLKVIIDTNLPAGIAGLSFMLPGMTHLELPAWGKIEVTENTE